MADKHEGIYWGTFVAPNNMGNSVIVLKDGAVMGGDRGFIIRGTYQADVDEFRASVRIDQWNDFNEEGVLGPAESLYLNVTGTINLPEIVLQATIVGDEGTQLNGKLVRAGDLTA